jgi:hypothetical protein
MEQTLEAITQNLAERLCWQAARRDDTRVARRVYRTQVVDGVYRLDEGALRDDFFHCLRKLGVLALMEGVQGKALQREMVPVVHYLWRDGLKPLFGIESMNALPALLFSDAALMPLVGFNAQQVRHGVCQRGAAKRQPPRTAGPICPDPLANNIVPLTLRDLAAWFNGTIRALAQAGILGAKVTGMVDATARETTAAYEGCGHVSRTRKITEKHGHVREIEVTVYGWKPSVLIDAMTKIPLAVKGVPIHEHAVLSMRALVTQARAKLTGFTRLHQLVFARGFWDGAELWWLDHPGITCVVPAKDNMAVPVDARAPAAAGEGITIGRRVHTLRHGPGNSAWTDRQETAVVGIEGLTTDDQYGTPEHGRHHNRRDFEAHPSHAVVVRQWHGRDFGPGGNTVFLTNASVPRPLQPCDDDDDRSLIENCCLKETKQPWELGHPPRKPGRAGQVHVMFTFLMLALATAYRLQGEQAPLRAEPVGGQRWRRQLLEQTRDQIIVFAQRGYGSFPSAEFALLVGVKLKDLPPGIGTLQEVLAKYRRTGHE